MNWKPFKNLETLEEFSDSEKLIRFQPDIGFAIKYILSVPQWVCGRIVSRKEWPEPNNFAFAIIPWDPEKNCAVEQIGPMKIQSGVIMPNPNDPNKCILTKLDKGNLKYMPNFALRMLLEKKLMGAINQMVTDFKKSKTYTELTS